MENLKTLAILVIFFTLLGCGKVKYVDGQASDSLNSVTSGTRIDQVEPGQDSDKDGLTDLEELKLGTNAKVKDTDGGGVSDFEEVKNQTNPVDNPEDDLCCLSPVNLVLPKLEFIYNTDIFTDDSQKTVGELVEKIQGLSRIKSISITGHTDSDGSDEYNQILSEKRAQAVKQILISDVPLDRKLIEANGVGEMAPVSDNGSEQGRQRNRRVEVKINFE